jgi:hypothetical protein
VHLHRGHLPAASNGTGLVKCFTYRQCLHFHRIECSSCGSAICFSAFVAVSRIASRAAFSVLDAGSINSIPSAEASQIACATRAPKDGVKALSCSGEHIRLQRRRPDQKIRYELPSARSSGPNAFSNNSRNTRVTLVVRLVEYHVPQFAHVH